jgi:hypothetical protein
METKHYHKLRHRYEDLPNDAKTNRLMIDIIRHTSMGMDLAILLHVVLMTDDRYTHSAQACYAKREAHFPHFYTDENVRGNV